MLAIIIKRAKIDGQIKGVVPHLVDGGLSILQYVDDMIIFMEHNMKKARNLKLILSAFEQLSSLKINFHKVNFFVLARPKSPVPYTLSYSAVGKVSFQSIILAFRFTSGG